MYKGTIRSVPLVIVFSVLSCGIYIFYWIYQISQELKYYLNDDSINPGLDLLLCIICMPYIIYWCYKTGKLIMAAQQKANLYSEDNSILYLILSIFGLGIVSYAIMQANLNKVWEA